MACFQLFIAAITVLLSMISTSALPTLNPLPQFKLQGDIYLTNSEDPRLTYLGEESIYAASSCREIATRKPSATSGYYYLMKQSYEYTNIGIAYCDLEREFIPDIRGWMRIGQLNMSNPAPGRTCPKGFEYHQINSKWVCRPSQVERGCTLITLYPTASILWTKLCGKLIVHYERSTDGLGRHNSLVNCQGNPCKSVMDQYADGIIFTDGADPRYNTPVHYWTVSSHANPEYIPLFVGESYSVGPSGSTVEFCTEPPAKRFNRIGVNVCRDQNRGEEDLSIELLELYVR